MLILLFFMKPVVLCAFLSNILFLTSGPMRWVQREMRAGSDPRRLLGRFIPTDVSLPDDLDDFTLWKLLVNIISEPPRRRKLPDINTLEDVLQLLKESSRIIVLTGAGVCKILLSFHPLMWWIIIKHCIPYTMYTIGMLTAFFNHLRGHIC